MRRTRRRFLRPTLGVLVWLAVGAGPLGAQDDRPDRRVSSAELQNAINRAISDGCLYLKKVQREDGAWLYDGRAGPGMEAAGDDANVGLTALALYALAASRMRADDDAIVRGLAWSRQHKTECLEGAFSNYSSSLMIQALTRIDAKEHKPWVDELAKALIRSQRDHGPWTYVLEPRYGRKDEGARPQGPMGNIGDNSNTQYAVLALWSAQVLSGVRVPKKTWAQILDYFERSQKEDLGWPYWSPELAGRGGDTRGRPGRGPGGGPGPGGMEFESSSPNMTAAGLSSWVYARSALKGGTGYLEKARKEKLPAKALEAFLGGRREWNWRDPYFLYALERVGTALDVPIDQWYEEGARLLVDTQAKDGRWGGRRGPPGADPARPMGAGHGDSRQVYDTALSLLFLSRATSYSVTGGH